MRGPPWNSNSACRRKTNRKTSMTKQALTQPCLPLLAPKRRCKSCCAVGRSSGLCSTSSPGTALLRMPELPGRQSSLLLGTNRAATHPHVRERPLLYAAPPFHPNVPGDTSKAWIDLRNVPMHFISCLLGSLAYSSPNGALRALSREALEKLR